MLSAMQSTREWTEWHLTPRGWETGTCMMDEADDYSEPCPADRVLTYFYKRIDGPLTHANRCLLKLVWCSEDQERIQELIRQYGDCLHNVETAA
jgi:hypothetical protein